MPDLNRLFYGDNLDVLRQSVAAETIDLVYLDPPFNSNRAYNVIFNRHDVSPDDARAQIQAFDDTWRWTPVTEDQFNRYVGGELPSAVADALTAFRTLLGENDAMAYLVNMAPRLVELHRVLKPTGSVYLHCDQTMAHYLKVLMDTIFGTGNFLNNVVWLYGLGGSSSRYWPRKHDDLLWYSKSPDRQYFNADKVPARSQMMAGQMKKAPDYWDIPSLNNMAKERLGYPTQKPLALLERVVRSSCPEDGVVLDPFCGCGTAIDASIRLGRPWMGIDVTYIAIDLIEKRLKDTYGDEISDTYEVLGIPRDSQAALALFSRNPFDFERWAVSLMNAQPNQKQVGDKGIDGVARFPLDARGNVGRVLVSVKGGKQLNPSMVRDLGGTVTTQKGEMGVLITNGPPTRGMTDEANHAGSYTHPNFGSFPRIQIITVGDLLSGKRPTTPPLLMPYIKALKAAVPADQASLFE